MEWLNYHHLLYFWLTARAGSVTLASAELQLAQSTVSAQVHQLEHVLGAKLFRREARRLVLTEVGRVVYHYADEIFALGRELLATIRDRPTGRPLRLAVGVADHVPALVAYRLLAPALALDLPPRLVCVDWRTDDLLAALATRKLDVVLAAEPVAASATIRAFNHLLCECDVTFFASPRTAAAARRRFPASLDGARMLLPAEGTTLRRSLDQWFASQGIRPQIVAELADDALLQTFGQAGRGVFPGPTVVEREVCRQYGVRPLGRVDAVKERFYAVSLERRLAHPVVVAIAQAAKTTLAG